MSSIPDPLAAAVRSITEPDPVRAALRAEGPLVDTGRGWWVVTEAKLAREVLADQRIVKDPAFAPSGWPGLEPPASAQLSLTTLDGPAHARLRQAHGKVFCRERIAGFSTRTTTIARELLSELGPGTVDLMDDFTTRFPLTVLLDVLGAPLDQVDKAALACRQMFSGEYESAMKAFLEVSASALSNGRNGLAVELREQLPDVTENELHYLLFGLIFAGQLTTDVVLGFVIAHALEDAEQDAATLVKETLRAHPPAPLTLWRFTSADLEIAGVRLPANTPILVDIEGINTSQRQYLTFGAGPHYCTGAQLAQLELTTVVTVLRNEFPQARLAVPLRELTQARAAGTQGSRLTALPIDLGRPAT